MTFATGKLWGNATSESSMAAQHINLNETLVLCSFIHYNIHILFNTLALLFWVLWPINSGGTSLWGRKMWDLKTQIWENPQLLNIVLHFFFFFTLRQERVSIVISIQFQQKSSFSVANFNCSTIWSVLHFVGWAQENIHIPNPSVQNEFWTPRLPLCNTKRA